MKRLFIALSIVALTLPAMADHVKATIHADQAGAKINREISAHVSMVACGLAKTHRFPTSKVTARTCLRP